MLRRRQLVCRLYATLSHKPRLKSSASNVTKASPFIEFKKSTLASYNAGLPSLHSHFRSDSLSFDVPLPPLPSYAAFTLRLYYEALNHMKSTYKYQPGKFAYHYTVPGPEHLIDYLKSTCGFRPSTSIGYDSASASYIARISCPIDHARTTSPIVVVSSDPSPHVAVLLATAKLLLTLRKLGRRYGVATLLPGGIGNDYHPAALAPFYIEHHQVWRLKCYALVYSLEAAISRSAAVLPDGCTKVTLDLSFSDAEISLSACAVSENGMQAEIAAWFALYRRLGELYRRGAAEIRSARKTNTNSAFTDASPLALFEYLQYCAKVLPHLTFSAEEKPTENETEDPLQRYIEVTVGDEQLDSFVRFPDEVNNTMLANLIIANYLSTNYPQTWHDFKESAFANGHPAFPAPHITTDFAFSGSSSRLEVRHVTKDSAMSERFPGGKKKAKPFPQPLFVAPPADTYVPYVLRFSEFNSRSRNHHLYNALRTYQPPSDAGLNASWSSTDSNDSAVKKMFSCVHSGLVSIIEGPPGSGKTTQVPLIILKEWADEFLGAHCNIICAAPRRNAVTAAYSRLKYYFSLYEDKPPVGYFMHWDQNLAKDSGSINYMTYGILRNLLAFAVKELERGAQDPLSQISHIILDDFYSRSLEQDTVLTLAQRYISLRFKSSLELSKHTRFDPKLLRVIIMGANVDNQMIKYECRAFGKIGEFTIKKPMFKVSKFFLEDYINDLGKSDIGGLMKSCRQGLMELENHEIFSGHTLSRKKEPEFQHSSDPVAFMCSNRAYKALQNLAASLILHIIRTTSKGSILVFLPGIRDINTVYSAARSAINSSETEISSNIKFHLLHSRYGIDPSIFLEDRGSRHVYLSTDIAESSITIPDLEYVIDSGLRNAPRHFNESHINQNVLEWVSKSSIEQRAGRVGRVKPGKYYALFFGHRYTKLPERPVPESVVGDVSSLWFTAKRLTDSFDISTAFMRRLPNPPSYKAIEESRKFLERRGLIAKSKSNTDMLTLSGQMCSVLSLDSWSASLISHGLILKCLDPMLVLIAANGGKKLFNDDGAEISKGMYFSRRLKALNSFSAQSDSDFYAIINAFNHWRRVYRLEGPTFAREFSLRHGINDNEMLRIYDESRKIHETLVNRLCIPKSSSGLPREMFKLYRSQDPKLGGYFLNANSSKPGLLKNIFLAAMYPNVAVADDDGTFTTSWMTGITISESSILGNGLHSPLSNSIDSRGFQKGNLVTYNRCSQFGRDSYVIYDVSLASPAALGLFAADVQREENELKIDNWLTLRMPERQAESIMRLRYLWAMAKDIRLKKFLKIYVKESHDEASIPFCDSIAHILAQENPIRRDFIFRNKI
ncbi:hypothetical protein CANCADRAFT_45778 [Tortispora caseinolytica NRRL Y-17796]|uniref:Helicase C-terminal domain-containing protein n=1 Tax=Tortispora caseinolytica NRRL Y-17796 TaxID=767744 RepID=A0A1E4TC40_9ASCO|nr:hypothetical protein CANCADRAFT_45778 [Tortispora caseinolytica NRRL Y-17796]